MMNLINFYESNGLTLLGGFWVTIQLCFLGVIGSIILGAILFLIGTIKNKLIHEIYKIYVDSVRGIPLLILLFLIYYAGPRIGILLDSYVAGLLGLIIYGSAYFAEIYRAGFESIPVGQIEAARVLGMNNRSILFRIRIPYMLSLVLPQLSNQTIVLIKESAVLSVITVPELTFITGEIINRTYVVILPYVAAGVLYWVFVQTIDSFGQLIEKYVHVSTN